MGILVARVREPPRFHQRCPRTSSRDSNPQKKLNGQHMAGIQCSQRAWCGVLAQWMVQFFWNIRYLCYSWVCLPSSPDAPPAQLVTCRIGALPGWKFRTLRLSRDGSMDGQQGSGRPRQRNKTWEVLLQVLNCSLTSSTALHSSSSRGLGSVFCSRTRVGSISNDRPELHRLTATPG